MSDTPTSFVIMPHHTKTDVDGNEVDFDEIYEYVITEAVELVPNLDCKRCDDYDQPGWIPSTHD